MQESGCRAFGSLRPGSESSRVTHVCVHTIAIVVSADSTSNRELLRYMAGLCNVYSTLHKHACTIRITTRAKGTDAPGLVILTHFYFSMQTTVKERTNHSL